jgi:5'-nucleotidase
MGKKVILITNDDGFDAVGLQKLVEAVSPLGEVWVVAPAHHKSACGHSLTLTRPLRLVEVGERFYKIDDGTPTDGIFIALAHLFRERKPDLILSGINHGANMGEDVTYSGTIGGAMEGAIHDIPAIAFSQVLTSFERAEEEEKGKVELLERERSIDWKNAQKVAYLLTKGVLEGKITIPHRHLLNVNIPNVKKLKGFQITRAGYRHYLNDIVVNRDPRGNSYFWIGLHPLSFKEEPGTDFWAIKQGKVSITPLTMDLTAYQDLSRLKESIGELFTLFK